MSLQYLTRRTALNATTKNPVTTNFNHLRSIPRAWRMRKTKHDPKLKSVRHSDRIKWWNVVPGDQIRLRGDKEGTLHDVLSINRLSNQVFLKGVTHPAKGEQAPQSKSFHYSRCQLYIGKYLLPPENDPNGPREMHRVFASRIGTSEPAWDPHQNRWVWKRYAVATIPKFPSWYSGQKIRIPWPNIEPRKYPEGGLYDTPIDEVSKITYEFPSFDPENPTAVPETPSEQEYLDLLYNPHHGGVYNTAAPYEVYLKMELANPHSRAKKHERWKSYQAGVHAALKKITDEELKYHDGRSTRQVKADAAFKWRELVKEEGAKKKKARWMHSAQMIKWQRKSAKKATKEQRQRRRLTELVLADEPNQFVPPSVKERAERSKTKTL